MKHLTEELWFDVPTRQAFINITPRVTELVQRSGVQEGLCLVNAMHITASVFINDDESGLHADYERWLEGLAPHEPIEQYRHNDTGEDNADAHMKRQVMGREVVVAITKGRLHCTGRGSRFSTANSTAAVASVCWSKLSATDATFSAGLDCFDDRLVVGGCGSGGPGVFTSLSREPNRYIAGRKIDRHHFLFHRTQGGWFTEHKKPDGIAPQTDGPRACQKVRVRICVGGWGLSAGFAPMTANAQARTSFVQQLGICP